MREKSNYPEYKIGDKVVIFEYWNTRPDSEGTVIAQSDHFVHIRFANFPYSKEWFSKQQVEKITPHPHES